MSVSRLFSIIGDGNVRRNMTSLNIASRASMKSAQVIACSNLDSIDAALAEVRPESSVCVFAAVTELIIMAEDCGTVAATVDTALLAFKSKIEAFCKVKPDLHVVVSPPLYRHQPFWYQRHLPQIADFFSGILSDAKPENLHMMPSFNTQELNPDGVHLNPVSGLHFVLHLFDQAELIMQNLVSTPNAQLVRVQEACRRQDDRLTFIEQRHARLDRRADLRAASDAEFRDWVTNRNEEDWLTIQGAPRLSQKGRSEWQVAAKKQVTDIIKLVFNIHKVHLSFKVLYVKNPIPFRTTGQTILNVRMNSVEASERVRETYSGFFRKNSPIKLPGSLKGVSIHNKVTLDTRIRISILHALGSVYTETNPRSRYKVRGFESRPLLMTIPAPDDTTSRVRVYNFIEAACNLNGGLSDESLMKIHQKIGTHHDGQLQTLFVILDDDQRERIESLLKERNARGREKDHRDRSGGRKGPRGGEGAVSTSGTVSGFGSGMEVSSLLALPPPPPPLEAPGDSRVKSKRHRSRSRSPSPRRGSKRHRSTSRERKKKSRSKPKKKRHSSSSGSSSDTASRSRSRTNEK